MFKKKIKKIIGEENIKKMRAYKNYLVSLCVCKKKYEILSNNVKEYSIIQNPKGHIFCGYFDINPDNPYCKDEILANMLKKNAKYGKDYMEIVKININTKKIEKLCRTKTWCWQMGCRSRWSIMKNVIIYNDYINEHYCSIFYDIEKRKIVKEIPYALYDIDKKEKFGLSINFSRLQRLRPRLWLCK